MHFWRKNSLTFLPPQVCRVFSSFGGSLVAVSPETSSYPWLCLRWLEKKHTPQMVVKPFNSPWQDPYQITQKTNIFVPKMVIFPSKTLDTLLVFSHVTLPKVNHWTKRIDAYLTGITTKLTSVLARSMSDFAEDGRRRIRFQKHKHIDTKHGAYSRSFFNRSKKNELEHVFPFKKQHHFRYLSQISGDKFYKDSENPHTSQILSQSQYVPGTPRPSIYKWLAINGMMNQIFIQKMVGNHHFHPLINGRPWGSMYPISLVCMGSIFGKLMEILGVLDGSTPLYTWEKTL